MKYDHRRPNLRHHGIGAGRRARDGGGGMSETEDKGMMASRTEGELRVIWRMLLDKELKGGGFCFDDWPGKATTSVEIRLIRDAMSVATLMSHIETLHTKSGSHDNVSGWVCGLGWKLKQAEELEAKARMEMGRMEHSNDAEEAWRQHGIVKTRMLELAEELAEAKMEIERLSAG